MYSDANSWNKQIVTFSAVAVLFLGSLFYFVSTAFRNAALIQAHDTGTAALTESL